MTLSHSEGAKSTAVFQCRFLRTNGTEHGQTILAGSQPQNSAYHATFLIHTVNGTIVSCSRGSISDNHNLRFLDRHMHRGCERSGMDWGQRSRETGTAGTAAGVSQSLQTQPLISESRKRSLTEDWNREVDERSGGEWDVYRMWGALRGMAYRCRRGGAYWDTWWSEPPFHWTPLTWSKRDTWSLKDTDRSVWGPKSLDRAYCQSNCTANQKPSSGLWSGCVCTLCRHGKHRATSTEFGI